MGFFLTDWIKGGVGELVGGVGDIIDKVTTTDEERLKAKAELQKLANEFELKLQDGLTERHRSDMASDSWLSKNVRPMMLVAAFMIVVILSLTDGNIGGFQVKESYLELYQVLLWEALAFYFGGRSFEKISSIKRK